MHNIHELQSIMSTFHGCSEGAWFSQFQHSIQSLRRGVKILLDDGRKKMEEGRMATLSANRAESTAETRGYLVIHKHSHISVCKRCEVKYIIQHE